ncbi:N-acetyltransferase [Streptomyces minutiscleroticus]|uniref:N-acetyltransferase n=1 Tax=Streptomyces minutiscleroticus TaxID=68238 RepID=A0A918U609_9ACTN|nr:GNAT family N-acetyltransferase [Streptomyces minutiscleroticus]GGX98662.1 N-acetyltransferase [Streptomyces minutiscleroticus]
MTSESSPIPVVRSVRADEWPQVKELRLAALQDPVAPLAFLESHDDVVTRPDAYWRERTEGAAAGRTDRQQVIVEAPADGRWLGSVTVLVEEAGTGDPFGTEVDQRQAHLVGVFVRPEARGKGITERLFAAALEWAWDVAGVDRVRLFVHERNSRAEGFYRKIGFVPTGRTVPVPGNPGQRELEFVRTRKRA